MQLPTKLRSGQNFKKSTVLKVNEIIDYLKTQRLVSDDKTIRLNQFVNGIGISATQSSVRSNSRGVYTNFSWKLKTGTVADTEQKVLCIHRARVNIDGNQGDRAYICYQPNQDGFDQYLPLPTQDGVFQVIGYAVYDQNATSANATNWQTGVFYKESTANLDYCNGIGFVNWLIGQIEVETVDDEKKYTITQQLLESGFDMYDGELTDYFKLRFTKSSYPQDGSILSDNFYPDGVYINGGVYAVEDQQYQVDPFTESITISEDIDKLYYLQIDRSQNTGTIVSSDEELPFSNLEQYIYNFPIARVSFGSAGIETQQYIDSFFWLSSGKVYLNENDRIPGYLEEKYILPFKEKDQLSETEAKYFVSGKQYLIGVRDQEEQSEQPNLFDNLYWNYISISGFDEQKDYILECDKGNLKWSDYYVKVDQEDTKGYLGTKFTDSNNISFSVENKKIKAEVKQGTVHSSDGTVTVTFSNGKFDLSTDGGDGKVKVNDNDKGQYLRQKLPDNDSIIYEVVTTTVGQDTVYRMKAKLSSSALTSSDSSIDLTYTASTGCYDIKDMGKVKVSVNDTNDYLMNQFTNNNKVNFFTVNNDTEMQAELGSSALTSSDSSVDLIFNNGAYDVKDKGYVRVNASDTLDYLNSKFGTSTSVYFEQRSDNKMYAVIAPTAIDSSDDSIDVIYDTSTNTFDLKDKGYVKVNANDTLDYLNVKFGTSTSVYFEQRSDNKMYAVLAPTALTSSDDSVEITYNDGTFDLKSQGGKVKVSQDDDPDYLQNQFSNNESIQFSSDGDTVQANLASTAIKSSEETLDIQYDSDKGTFDINDKGMVSVDGTDYPNYLFEKVMSLDGSINLEKQGDGDDLRTNIQINPQYFKSTDESIDIEYHQGTGNAYIDLKDNCKVKCSDDDDPDYLGQKIVSENTSISVGLGSSGQSEAVNLQVNPQYFFSSDETVDITETEDGLDFTNAGRVQITQGDQADFLSQKVVSSKNHLTVEVGTSGVNQALDLNINTQAFTSSDQSITITTTADNKIDFKDNCKVKCSDDDDPDYLGQKLVSENTSIAINLGSSGQSEAVNLQINPQYFTSSDNSIEITETDNGLDFKDKGYVKVNANDTADYLNVKFGTSTSVYFQERSDNKMYAVIAPTAIDSSDDSIDVIYDTSTNTFDLKDMGKVKVNANDTNDYLNVKFGTSTSVYFEQRSDNKMYAVLAPTAIASQDQSITVTYNDDGTFDLKNNGKVKVSETDTNDYLQNQFKDNTSIQFDSDGDQIEAKLAETAIDSSDDSLDITYTDGTFDIKDSGKVKTSETDTNDYLQNQFNNNSSIQFDSDGDKVQFKLAETAIDSSDDSIDVEYTDGTFDIKGNGKVKTSATDTNDYLQNQFKDNTSIKHVSDGDKVQFKLVETAIDSSDDSIDVEYNDGTFDIKDNGKVKTSATDTADYLENQVKDNASIQFSSDGDQIEAKLASTAIDSSDNSIDVTFDDGTFDLKDSGKTKVSATDTADYLQNQFTSNASIKKISDGTVIQFKLESTALTSSDNSFSLTYNDGIFDLKDYCYVKVNANDTADYLNSKFGTSTSVYFEERENKMYAVLAPTAIDSSDDSIDVIYDTSTNTFDLKDMGKVKVNANDTNDYLNVKFGTSTSVYFEERENKMYGVLSPTAIASQDESIQVTYVTETKTFDLKNNGKVKCSANDVADYLGQKFVSDNESIAINLSSGGQAEAVNLQVNPQYFLSSDDSVTITETEDGLDFTGAGKVQVTQNDQAGYLGQKIVSSKGHLTVQTGTSGVDQAVDLNIDTSIFTSSDQSVTITATEDSKIDFTGAGKVQVDQNDTAGYLDSKIEDTASIQHESTGSSIEFNIAEGAISSSDDSLDIEYDDGTFDIKDSGKVKVNESDSNDYLNVKFGTSTSVYFEERESKMYGVLAPTALTSSDDSIDVIYDTSTNTFDLKDMGKVKCSDTDTADYLNSKIEVDSSIASLITLEKTGSVIKIKSAIEGSGLMIVNNGSVSVLTAPSGNAVLGCSNGSFSWLQYATCENACQ